MNRHLIELIRNLLPRNQQEPSRLLELAPKLFERFEPNLGPSVRLPPLNPFLPKPSRILLQRRRPATIRLRIYPFFSGEHHIVIGKSEKLVMMLFVPIHNHFWIIIAIAP